MGRKPSQSSLQQPKMTAQQTCRPKVEPQITGRQGWAAALKQQQAQAQLQRADGRDGDEGGGRDGGRRRRPRADGGDSGDDADRRRARGADSAGGADEGRVTAARTGSQEVRRAGGRTAALDGRQGGGSAGRTAGRRRRCCCCATGEFRRRLGPLDLRAGKPNRGPAALDLRPG